MIFEVCVDSVAGALAAERAGAQRIELCSGLALGGLTPSIGLIEQVRSSVQLDVNVLIRPRGGDFDYSPDEFLVMQADIATIKSMPIQGIVCGILNPAGGIDIDRMQILVSQAQPLQFTFHRAFDHCADRSQALEILANLGVKRVLTSGGASTAWEGRFEIAQLVQQAKGRISILAGGGINETNAEPLVQSTRVAEIHFSGRRQVESRMIYRNPAVRMGTTDENYTRMTADPERILQIIRSVQRITS